jgi:hypothetical protein
MTNEQIISEVIREATPILDPIGFTPLGPAAATKHQPVEGIPQNLDELTTIVTRTYDLSVTAAGELNIPVVGTVSGGVSRRVVVLERTAYKEITDPAGTRRQYGYALRLALTVGKITAEAKMTLPFLAASAELGQVEAKWTLQVMGLSGPKIDAAMLPPKELNLETFVLANQSLQSLINAVRDPQTRFTAALVALFKPVEAVEREYRASAGRAYALARIERGRKRLEALNDLGQISQEMRDAIVDTYKDVAGITSDIEAPAAEARAKASALLGPIRVDAK